MTQRDPIAEALRYDPLDTAEKLTGKNYKDYDGTTALGMLLGVQNAERKETLLRANNDTHNGITYKDAYELALSLGFEDALYLEFEGNAWGDEPNPIEQFRIMWHPDGLLLKLESYQRECVNMIKVFFNIDTSANPNGLWDSGVQYSGGRGNGTNPDVLAGDVDVREGLRWNMEALKKSGTLLSKWSSDPFLWLLHYMDTKDKDYDYKAINAERIALLPQHVREAITVTQ